MATNEHTNSELAEWDLLVGLVLAQLTDAQREHGRGEWLSTATLAHAVRELGRRGADAVHGTWAQQAETRGLVQRRARGGDEEVRLQGLQPE
jgi:hypothetical protein